MNLTLGQRDIIFQMEQTMARVPLLVRARFFDGLADPARLALLQGLRHGEGTAGEIAAAAALTPSNASKHLACLRDCGLVLSPSGLAARVLLLGDRGRRVARR